MKAFLFPLAVMASSVMAQTTTCGADYIVESCLTSETSKLNNCGTEDYDCRCAQWKNIMTCYNNCPNDPRQHSSDGQRQIWCGYASQFATTQATQAPAPTKTGANTPAQNTQNAGGDSTEGDGTASATTSSSGPADTNSAASLALNAGGVLAAVAGVFAVVL